MQAGCRVGTLMQRLVLRARNKEAHGGEARTTTQEIRDWYGECPWDPLWWCGVAAMPRTPLASTFEEYAVRDNAMSPC